MDTSSVSDKSDNYLYDYVIYHRNCIDGFSGFFILTATNRIHDNAIIFPDDPFAKNVPPGIAGKNVIIIDVAYKANILKEIVDKARKVTYIDHHVTNRADIMALNIGEPHELVYSENKKSGASLTWAYFHRKSKMPLFIKYVEDNDIGAWKLKHTGQFILALSVNYSLEPTKENLAHWKKLFNKKEVFRLIKKGIAYNEYEESLLQQNIKRYSMESFPGEKIFNDFPGIFKAPGQYKVAVYCGNGCPSNTSLGATMMEKLNCDFVLMWVLHLDRKEYRLSFRSGERDNNVVDVGEIAKMFGGGGHKQASSCSFPISRYNITDLFSKNSLPRENK